MNLQMDTTGSENGPEEAGRIRLLTSLRKSSKHNQGQLLFLGRFKLHHQYLINKSVMDI